MIEIRDLSIKIGDFIVENLSFRVEKGEYFMLLGMSGAGKSVLLETIMGLVKPQNGHIYMNGKDITNCKIQDRKLAIVFQDFAIFPNLTVFQNIAFPLKQKKKTFAEIKTKVTELAGQMNIIPLLHRDPVNLSGGELQRVALARALASEPDCLLLDEPLSSVDAKLRFEIQSLLRQINRNGTTIIHVTHNYEEVVSLAHKVAVLHEGKIVQYGTPHDVFTIPATRFVAEFTGIRNYFRGKRIDENNVLAENKLVIKFNGESASNDGNLLFRSDDIILSLHELDSSACNRFEGIVKDIIPATNGVHISVDCGLPVIAHITTESVKKLEIEIGKKIWIHFKASAVKFI